MTNTTTAAFAAEIASVRNQILDLHTGRLTYTVTTADMTLTTRSLKAAYAAYDKAISAGQPVTFVNSRGVTIADR